MNRYRVVPPGGGAPRILEFEAAATVAEAYFQVAAEFGLPQEDLSLRLRNPPGSTLPFFHLRCSEDMPLWQVAPHGSVLVTELLSTAEKLELDAAETSACAAAPAMPYSPPARRPAERRGLTGLVNFGNTCYLNSALQCLSATSALTDRLLQPGASAGPLSIGLGEGRATDGRVATAYADVLSKIWSSEGDGEPFAPRSLKAAVADRRSTFTGSGQQDAQELLTALLEGLHDDLRRRPVEVGAVPIAEGASDEERADTSWRAAEATDASAVSDVFQGQLRSELRCLECGACEAAFDPFWSLSLPVPRTPVATLEEALNVFCAEEPLEDPWPCPRCQHPVRATKRLGLWRLPPVLQLHLKRFEWKGPERRAERPAVSSTSKGGAVPAPAASQEASSAAAAAAEARVTTEHGDLSVTPAGVADEPAPAAASAEGVEAQGLAGISSAIGLDTPWDAQESMYVLVIRLLDNIVQNPLDAKFRSIGKSSGKLRADVLSMSVGAALLGWAGFSDTGERFDASGLPAEEAEQRRAELQKHAEAQKMRHLRRVRDARIEEERRRRLPTGDTQRIRRWGGQLPSFGGSAGVQGLSCVKLGSRLALAPDSGRARGLELLRLGPWLATGAPASTHMDSYELHCVVDHHGSTPFSGHYTAVCWHEASSSWHRFNDSVVSRVPKDHQHTEVLSGDSYVLLLCRVSTCEESVMVTV